MSSGVSLKTSVQADQQKGIKADEEEQTPPPPPPHTPEALPSNQFTIEFRLCPPPPPPACSTLAQKRGWVFAPNFMDCVAVNAHGYR